MQRGLHRAVVHMRWCVNRVPAHKQWFLLGLSSLSILGFDLHPWGPLPGPKLQPHNPVSELWLSLAPMYQSCWAWGPHPCHQPFYAFASLFKPVPCFNLLTESGIPSFWPMAISLRSKLLWPQSLLLPSSLPLCFAFPDTSPHPYTKALPRVDAYSVPCSWCTMYICHAATGSKVCCIHLLCYVKKVVLLLR